jgi:hypothetical protein
MPVSKNRKDHKAKAAKRRKEHELKRHRTAQLGAKINEAIRAYKAQEELESQLPYAASLPSFEILPNQNSII